MSNGAATASPACAQQKSRHSNIRQGKLRKICALIGVRLVREIGIEDLSESLPDSGQDFWRIAVWPISSVMKETLWLRLLFPG
jgi:hypothetical protein